MATVTSFTGPADPIAPGASADFTAAFAVSPGDSDETLTAELRGPDGAVRGTATVVLDRPDPEADPVLAVAETPGAWYVRVIDGQGNPVGSVSAVNGTRDDPSTFTATFTWIAP